MHDSLEAVFVAKGLTKVYRMGEVEVHALRGVDLEIRAGELIVLLGPSGSGKSTLLNILGGLDFASGGTALFRDHDLTQVGRARAHALPARARRLRLPVLQPDPVAHRARERGAGHRDRRASDDPRGRPRASSGSDSRFDHFPAQLSGGEQQRVAVARAVAKRPDVLLCDEPTGALDYETGKLVLDAIARVNQELGTTTAVITHNAAIAAMAERVLHLADGRIVSEERNRAPGAPGGPALVRTLDRKLLRDLARMKGQVITIALVVACGIASFVSALTTYESLRVVAARLLRDAPASRRCSRRLERAPSILEARLREIPGVAQVETRLVFDVSLDAGGGGPPAVGRMVSIPQGAQPTLNALHLRAGRLVEPGHVEEVLVSEGFAAFHRLRVGDRLSAVLNGRRQDLRVAGVALSPEYVFAIRGGDPLPDDRGFAVLWTSRDGLEAAFDMAGAFNDVVLTLAPGVDDRAVIDALDRLLEPYGGIGAIARAEQPSHRFIEDEIRQNQTMATTIPPIFLGVAAFLLNVVLGRLVATQREQIAAMKAVGYGNATIGLALPEVRARRRPGGHRRSARSSAPASAASCSWPTRRSCGCPASTST